ncbi:hypothetical protein [Ensifer sp. Root278]|nr:hypothetical protein [Ensifer sp. Root278]
MKATARDLSVRRSAFTPPLGVTILRRLAKRQSCDRRPEETIYTITIMNLRFVAGGMAVALLCAIAIVLFAPRTEPLTISYYKYEFVLPALRKRPDAAREFIAMCAPEIESELKETDLKETSYSNRAEMAQDLCRRYFAVVIDGRLTLAEINLSGSFPLSLLEEAERRQPRFPR